MNKLILMAKVATKLMEVDQVENLVNFFDDEVDWDAIAKVAVELVLEEVSGSK